MHLLIVFNILQFLLQSFSYILFIGQHHTEWMVQKAPQQNVKTFQNINEATKQLIIATKEDIARIQKITLYAVLLQKHHTDVTNVIKIIEKNEYVGRHTYVLHFKKCHAYIKETELTVT